MQVRRVAEENGVDVSNQIQELETRAMQVRTSARFLGVWAQLGRIKQLCMIKSFVV